MFSRWIWTVALFAAMMMGATAQGADPKPLFVMSIAPVDEILGDVDYLAKLLGADETAKQARQVAGPLLGGIDRKRPAGSYLIVNGDEVKMIVFVPVISLKAQLAILEDQLGKPEDVGGGVFKFTASDNPLDEEMAAQPVFVKEENGWAFITSEAKFLTGLPKDPSALLAGLDKRYDLGYRIQFDSVTPEKRQEFVDYLRTQLEGEAGAALAAGTGPVDAKVMKSMLESVITFADGIQSLEFGFTIDEPKKALSLAFAIDAQPGSQLEKSLAATRGLTTQHHGVLVRGAAYLVHRKVRIAKEDIAAWDSWVDLLLKDMRDAPPTAVAVPLTEADRQEMLTFVERVMKAMHADGEIDYGSSMIVEDGKVASIGGMHMADLPGLEAELRRMIKKNQAKFDESITIEWDFATHQGVRLIKATPQEGDTTLPADLTGGEKSIYLGVDKNYVYMAQGYEALKQLKTAIDRSRSGPPIESTPLRVRVNVQELAKLAAAQIPERTPAVDALLAALTSDEHKHTIRVHLAPNATGALEGRLEVDDGVLAIAPQLGQVISEWFGKIMAENQQKALQGFDLPAEVP